MLIPIPAAPPPAPGTPVNAAAFGIPIDHGIQWEDPREIHRVVVRFKQPPGAPRNVRLEYWSSRWPDQRLPRDREPGGGDVGWWELGNWYTGEWRKADTNARADGEAMEFTFRPMDEHERPDLKGFKADYRFTLKVRVAADGPVADVQSIEAYTDSVWAEERLWLTQERPVGLRDVTAFNGYILKLDPTRPDMTSVRALVARSPNPNTFDRTLVTVRAGKTVFTFRPDDLGAGPLLVPSAGMAVALEADKRSYADIRKAPSGKTLYERVKELPEQTWASAWAGMPPKRGDIYIPLGLDGGRQRFRLDANGGVVFRTNDHYLRARPGKDTPRLDLLGSPIHVSFGLPDRPAHRTLFESTLPIVDTTWEADGIWTRQEVFVTTLDGAQAGGPVPSADATAVLMMRFTLANPSDSAKPARLAMRYRAGDADLPRLDAHGFLSAGGMMVGGWVSALSDLSDRSDTSDPTAIAWHRQLGAGESLQVLVKLPYVVLRTPKEQEALADLDFDRERKAMAGYWRRREDESAHLITPEPMLNEFYRAHAMHLLVNCELEPGAARRFARVGSFGYGAYGNESCMMVADLDRRGYHKEAQECLDAWLHYQGTAALPGDFDSKEGVLYGAGGYESGGYNQHHGWILWCMAEHYRFTRDGKWLRSAAPGIVKAAEWIIRQRDRTVNRADLAMGLLPAGSLEDIGDWWPWLSTNCYTWRGLDSAAWALEQIHHPDAARIRKQADDYHRALLAAFRGAMDRSPVVRLRDGTAVPHIPSTPYRRGRSFGWICETLEGALHLLITGALDPHSREAEWILKDYEDNLFLSNQYGYTLPDFNKYWFGRAGMSMQACLLLDAEPYLARDDVKNALRAIFNAIAVGYFPDARMLTEHALPEMGDWRGDHYKSSDEANACGWLRYLFVREEGDELLLGQAVPRTWLAPGQKCGIERAATYFGPVSVVYEVGDLQITATVDGPKRNPPKRIRLRFRNPDERPLASVTVNGKPWHDIQGDWVKLPGSAGRAVVVAQWR